MGLAAEAIGRLVGPKRAMVPLADRARAAANCFVFTDGRAGWATTPAAVASWNIGDAAVVVKSAPYPEPNPEHIVAAFVVREFAPWAPPPMRPQDLRFRPLDDEAADAWAKEAKGVVDSCVRVAASPTQGNCSNCGRRLHIQHRAGGTACKRKGCNGWVTRWAHPVATGHRVEPHTGWGGLTRRGVDAGVIPIGTKAIGAVLAGDGGRGRGERIDGTHPGMVVCTNIGEGNTKRDVVRRGDGTWAGAAWAPGRGGRVFCFPTTAVHCGGQGQSAAIFTTIAEGGGRPPLQTGLGEGGHRRAVEAIDALRPALLSASAARGEPI
jgi:hypothetical protein